jgi:hypothetical protein
MPKLNLKKYLFLSLFIAGFSHSTFAQSGNLPYADGKFIHFGFSLGMNTMSFGVTPSHDSINNSIYNANVSVLKPGFSVGVISDIRLFRYLNLRFTPNLNFGDRQINYTNNGNSTTDSLNITSVFFCLPVYLKYSAERKDNYRPYLIWGGGAYFDLARNKLNPVILKPLDFYTEFGVGCDIYFSFFKLAPELKFAIGFNNMLTPYSGTDADRIKLTNSLSKLTSRVLTLSFNFE